MAGMCVTAGSAASRARAAARSRRVSRACWCASQTCSRSRMNWAMLGVTGTGLPRSRTALVSALPHFDAPAMPFATIVTQDYDGWDTASDLNRPGVFRLNIAVGRTAFEKLTGYPPGEHDAQAVRFDYTALDRLLPH